jgi:hypothetical protein
VKLLLESTDGALLLEKAALLRSRGIPVHLEEVPHVGAVPTHIYVVFDRQYEDARSLLQDSQHVVSSPVFDEELAGIQDQVREVKLSIGNSLLEKLMIGILLLMTVGYVASRVFG